MALDCCFMGQQWRHTVTRYNNAIARHVPSAPLAVLLSNRRSSQDVLNAIFLLIFYEVYMFMEDSKLLSVGKGAHCMDYKFFKTVHWHAGRPFHSSRHHHVRTTKWEQHCCNEYSTATVSHTQPASNNSPNDICRVNCTIQTHPLTEGEPVYVPETGVQNKPYQM